jgi:hypothetical protein
VNRIGQETMARLLQLFIEAAAVLMLVYGGTARAQLNIESRCDGTNSHCVIVVGPPGNAQIIFIPLIGGTGAQLRCTKIREEEVWPARPDMRKCGLWQ